MSEPKPDRDAYYREAASWAQDRGDLLRASRRTAWIVAGVAVAVALCEAIALMLLMPLKRVEPYTLLVDRTTGYVQALKPLDEQRISGDTALTQSFLVQYVIARESFDRATVQSDYKKVGLWSADPARGQYVAQMQATNPDSPLVTLPSSATIETLVKSLSPLGTGTALVRFDTIRHDPGSGAQPAQPWVAVIHYGYSGEPMSVADRFLNPLGFQVVRYHRDPEALPQVEPATGAVSPDGVPCAVCAARYHCSMRRSILIAATAALWTSAVGAEVRPQPGAGDPRIQTVTFAPDQVIELDVDVGYQLTLELGPDEHIENVAVGDSSAWQVVADKRGNHLFVKALAAGAATNMVVLTDGRRYAFDLRSGGGGTSAYLVRFVYPDVAPAPEMALDGTSDADPVRVRYMMSGTRLLRPSAIAEDGVHTFLTFPANQPLPAIFGVDRLGRETLVNGAMRDGQYVIDGIEHVLIFRLDNQEARARRVVERGSRQLMAEPAASVDPRTLPPPEADVRPQVALPPSGVPTWALILGLGLFAIALFGFLNGRRETLSAPPVQARTSDGNGTSLAPAPLYVPPLISAPTPLPEPTSQPAAEELRRIVPAPVAAAPQAVLTASPPQYSALLPPISAPLPRTVGNGSPLVVDNTAPGTDAGPVGGSVDARGAQGSAALPTTHASMMADKGTTIVEGTLIPAVLESALDSTRPGPARALVTSSVRGWDGTRVLIPRGTRLFGEYMADVQPGQSRVQILWTRLIRPDGATIALSSPAGDTLGRVGVKGKVNSHFFTRFGAAILQTGLDIGANLATQAAGQSVIVAVPGSVVNAATPQLSNATPIPPTIRVKQGTSITVFVAHDLDFTDVERRP